MIPGQQVLYKGEHCRVKRILDGPPTGYLGRGIYRDTGVTYELVKDDGTVTYAKNPPAADLVVVREDATT